MRTSIPVVIVGLICLALGWTIGLKSHDHGSARGERKALFYQSPMHPWVKSPEPGVCTVCGMALVPVYADADAGAEINTIRLSTNAFVVAGIQTAVATNRVLHRNLRVAGKIMEAESQTRRLSAYIDGRIEKLHVNFKGAAVEEGELLATVYSPTLREAEREYVLLYRQSQMNHSTKITAEHGRLLAAMRQRLVQYGLLEKQIDALPNKPDRVSTSDIYSPLDGVVRIQNVYEGQYVDEGDLLFEIVDFYNLWFRFDVYEDVLESVKEGQRIEIEVAGKTGFKTSSVISFVNPNLNYGTRSAEVRAELRNPALRVRGVKQRPFKLDVYAEGTIQIPLGAIVSVPRSAVIDTVNEGAYVFVAIGQDSFAKRQVTVAARGRDYCGLSSGLKAGDTVVANGAALLDSEIRL